MTELERRDLVVSGALPRHQMRSYLKASGMKWEAIHYGSETRFTVWVTSDQWGKINEWVERTKVGS